MSDELKRFTARLYRLTQRFNAVQLIKLRAFERHADGAFHAHIFLLTTNWLPPHQIAALWNEGYADVKEVKANEHRNALAYVAKYVLKNPGLHKHITKMRLASLTGKCVKPQPRRDSHHTVLKVRRLTPWTFGLLQFASRSVSPWEFASRHLSNSNNGHSETYRRTVHGLMPLSSVSKRLPISSKEQPGLQSESPRFSIWQ